MKTTHRVLIVAALAGAVGAVLVMKPENVQQDSEPATVLAEEAPTDQPLPRLVDLGADTCIPCKMMAPILQELSETCADTFEVEFIDVWENPNAGEAYNISLIPTQIFYDAAGKELFRHEGFFGKEEILATWREYGVPVSAEEL